MAIIFGGVFVVMGIYIFVTLKKAFPGIRERSREQKEYLKQHPPKSEGPMNKTMKIFIIVMICLIVFVVVAVILAVNYFNNLNLNSDY